MAQILIVDDKEDNLYYLQVLLGGHGYGVILARHGAEALVKARQSLPDLVVSDLLMPVMDGYTLLRHWRADARLMSIPFIVYTATYTEVEDKQLALNLGANDFILKPCEPDDFVARIRDVLEQPEGYQDSSNGIFLNETGVFKQYSQTLIRKLEQKMLQLEETNRTLELEIQERKTAVEELNLKNRILKTEQEASLDAILVVGQDDNILFYNKNFIALWGIPISLLEAGLDSPVLQSVAEQVKNPQAFVSQVKYLYKHPHKNSRDELELMDGRIVDRYSAPIIDNNEKYYGRVWYFRDVTDRRRAQQTLLASEREQRQLAGELAIERARLVEAQRVAKIGSWESNLDTFEVVWSDEVYRIFEVDPACFVPTHQGVLEKILPEDRLMADDAFSQSLNQAEPVTIEYRIGMADGRVKFVEENWQVIFDKSGKATQAIGTCQDITEHKLNENKIRRLNRVLAVLGQINALIVRVKDRDELFNEACKIATEAGEFHLALIAQLDEDREHVLPVAWAGQDQKLFEVIREALASNGLSKAFSGQAIRERRAIVINHIQDTSNIVSHQHYTESGVHSMAVLPLIVSDEPMGIFALFAHEQEFFHDEEMQLLTELTGDIAFAIDHIEKRERLNYLAYYDPLTGLANRTLFLERVTQFIRVKEKGHFKTALFLLDLERFKDVNDSMGLAMGDVLLKQVAVWLKQYIGDMNLLARIEVDRFAWVLPDIHREAEAARFAEAMLAALLQIPFSVNGVELRLGAKIGIALFPEGGREAESLFRNAEAALKMAKRKSDRYLFHTRKMTEAVADKLALENRLRLAVSHEEFILYYQPKINSVSGQITGVEALIRWNDPHRGLIAPDKFIPVLEETGLIYEVGRWALTQAISDYLRWQSEGREAVRIAVNVSSLQLRNPGFAKEIEKNIAVHPQARQALELEITESMIVEDMTRSVFLLRTIRGMGISIAIDDFGTGFSSLGYLSKLPVDTLKIDQSFVREMTADPQGLTLVSTIISLAHSLKLKVVAEGVETQEQFRLLRLLNCDEMQGFLFSRPIPVDEFESAFLSGRKDFSSYGIQ